jgi:hypothetical protein
MLNRKTGMPDLKKGKKVAQQAISLNPSNPLAHLMMARFLLAESLRGESKRHYLLAKKLDPKLIDETLEKAFGL